MKFINKMFSVLVFVFLSLIFSSTLAAISVDPQWVKSVPAGSNSSQFNSITIDSSGNIYSGGAIYGSSCDFGNGVKVSGMSAGSNIVLVKYDSSGNAQWAKSVIGFNDSFFDSIAVDSSGNIYAGGTIKGTNTYDFGNGSKVSGMSSASNLVLVKYDSNGNTQWARSATAADTMSLSRFISIAVDSSGNIYAGGSIAGTGTYGFGNGVTVAGAYGSDYNLVLVKYDTNGNAQWAESTTDASNTSIF